MIIKRKTVRHICSNDLYDGYLSCWKTIQFMAINQLLLWADLTDYMICLMLTMLLRGNLSRNEYIFLF